MELCVLGNVPGQSSSKSQHGMELYLVKNHDCSELHSFIELCGWATRCQVQRPCIQN